MKKKISALLVIVFFITFATKSFAQDPNWSVNPSNYQFSATYTTSLNANGITLTSANDKVAAFVNGEIRGVANVTYVASVDKYVAYLTVYANTNNELINFKIYSSASNGGVFDALKTSIFKIDANVGDLFKSFVISDKTLESNGIFGDFNLSGSPKFKKVYRKARTDPRITYLVNPYPTDPDIDVFEFLYPKGTDVSTLVPSFNTLYNATVFIDEKKQVSNVVGPDFSKTVVYQLLSEGEEVVEETKIIVRVSLNDINSPNVFLTDVSAPGDIAKTIDIKFLDLVKDFSIDAFEVDNAVVSKLTKVDNKNYQVELVPISEGNFSITLKKDTIEDADGFPAPGATKSLSFTNDETSPIITNLEIKDDNGQAYFEITFSEPVTNFLVSDFEQIGTLKEIYTVASQFTKLTNTSYRLDIFKTASYPGSFFLKVKDNSGITDLSGNKLLVQETQSFFLENTAPIVTLTLPDLTAECALTVTDVQPIPSITDSFLRKITATTKDPLTYSEQGEYTLNWDFIDEAGNTTSIPQKIIIKDTFLPRFGVLDVIGECTATIEAPTRIDNCAGEITATTTDPVFYDVPGVYTVNWTLDDGNGNAVTVQQKVTVQDFTAPISPILDDIRAIGSVTLIPPTTTDNCGEILTGTTTSPLYYDQEGEYFINWFFADKNGNGQNASQRVFIFNANPTPPVLRDIVRECSYLVFEPARTTYINGEIIGTTTDPVNYTEQGEYEINWSFDYGNGTILQSKQKITIKDDFPPEITSLNDITANCSYTFTSVPTAFDFCSGNVVGTTADPLTYNTAGVYIINWDFEDTNGNKKTVPQKLTITDTTAPVSVVLPDVTAQCSVNLVAPKTTDNCAGTVTATTSDPVFYDSEGTYVVNWVFSDGNGNTTTATQNVIIDNTFTPIAPYIQDVVAECAITITDFPETTANGCSGTIVATTTSPLTYNQQGEFIIVWDFDFGNGIVLQSNQKVIIKDITAPVKPTLPTITAVCATTITDIPITTDNCGGIITGTTTDNLTYSFQGDQFINWTFNDGNGNTTIAQQRVIVKDTIAPVAPVLADISSDCTVDLTPPTALDNCDGIITAFATSRTSFSNEGTYVVTWVFQDFSQNISTAKQKVIISNNTPPTIPILADVIGECAVTVLTTPTTTDSCGNTISGKTTDALKYTTQGNHIINWIFDDGNGNSITVPQKVIVKDTLAPIVPNLLDVTDECSATVTTIPTTTDNCAGIITATTEDPLTYTTQGNHIINWVFDDGNGNTSTAIQKVIIKDTTVPVIPVLPDITDECSVTITNFPTTSDNCLGTITATTLDPLSYLQGNHTINWVFDDENGNSITVPQKVIIKDTVAPITPVLEDIVNECAVIISEKPTTTDNCGGIITGTTVNPLSYTNPGVYSINWIFNDGNGNSTSATQKITVNNAVLPTAPILVDIVDECEVTITEIPKINATLCSPTIIGTTTDSLTYTKEGNYTVTWNFDLGNGTILQSIQKIVIKDTKAPIIPVIADITGECAVNITSFPTTTDNCSGTIIATTTDPLTYNQQGNYTITWLFDDGNGNSATATQNVIVKDTQAPIVPVLPNVEGECVVTVSDIPTATDNCDGIITGVTTDPLTYNSQGIYTINWTFTDSKGNSSSTKQSVIVEDTTAPIIPNLTDIIGECEVSITNPPTTTDNCSGIIVGTTTDLLTYNQQGNYTITWFFTDEKGNSSSTIQNVIVKDTIAPIIPDLEDITGECSVTVITIPTTTDNCFGLVIGRTSDPLTYTTQGNHTINWIFDDGNGNITTAKQNVIIKGETAPIVPVLADIVSECSVTVSNIPTATDSCGDTITGTTTDNLAYNQQGEYTITWTFDDGNGNISTANQKVIVKDTTAPTVPNLADVSGECSVSITEIPTATDNCEGTITGTTTDALSYNQQGEYTILWTFDDGNGNVSTANQKVIVKDTTAPTILNLADVLAECSVSITETPTTTDNCVGTITGTTTDVLIYNQQGEYTIVWTFNDGNGNSTSTVQKVIINSTSTPTAPILPDIVAECSIIITDFPEADGNSCVGKIRGTTDNSLTYSAQGEYSIIWDFDYGNGLILQSSQKVIIKDTTAPTIPNLANVSGDCSVTITEIPKATDNCEGTITGTTTDALSYNQQGEYTIVWTFDDGNGNVSTANQKVIVKDAKSPEIPNLADVLGECSVSITETPTTIDNCMGTITGTTTDALIYNQQGEYTIVWTFDDGNGNVSTANQKVIIKDTTAPTVPNLADVLGECSVTITETPTTTDNCEGTITATTTDALSYNQQGEYTIVWTFDDGNGNVSTANQKVIVKDEINPIAITKDIEVELNDSGNVSITAADIDDGSTDNCSIDFIEVSKTNFTTQDLGENTIVFAVVDKAGNKAEVNVKVTVVDKVLSITIFELNKNIYLYPNPSKNSFKINLNIEKANVKIYDMLGKLVASHKNYISNESIDISNLPIGFFMVRISQNNKIISKRLAKF